MRVIHLAALSVVLLHCGTTAFSASSDGGADAGSRAPDGASDVSNRGVDTGVDGGRASDTGVKETGPKEAGATETGLVVEAGSVEASPAPDAPGGCPALGGYYKKTAGADVLGCIAFANGSVCVQIAAQGSGCVADFQASNMSGSATVTAGSTSGQVLDGTITEASKMRTGCDGDWSITGSAATMHVNCGGTSSAQGCDLTLTRSASTCLTGM